ncbi:uncharacterized protein LACBIDRAFT_329028 [Laccaria bicolor S238N-H82]|uniref:Predicted protein n=1 Tax=Laccaria bicolor (strain S238N-H82 / ATCC MYA-4686) TaxID=486041 RepID=B0DGT6_LACBS|nr:uncharacterized protein LACBIDRAFT_329028 [Laccaria bicolor S238N-H82]EDR06209.1 predicted protein [Laccaria bicolor S238N-H82]|eukprot:XP_001883070.1 predicted protein [Laccaria bicolor S238N-H82]
MPLLQTRRPWPPTPGRKPFSSEESAILRQYLEDFRVKTKEERKKLLMYEVYRLMKAKAPPLLTEEQWKERKTKIKEWFQKHGRRIRMPKFGYVKLISTRYVVAHLRQEQIHEVVKRLAKGAPPGSRVFLAKYQQGLKEVMGGLTDAEKEEYKGLAEEWTNAIPPPDVQRKLNSKHGLGMMREMDKVKQYQLGVFSWSLYLNYIQEFQQGPSDSPAQHCYTRLRQKRKAPHFDLDGGLPVLPLAPEDRAESGDLLKSLIREFMTIHYRLASGKPSVVVPWFCLDEHRNTLWESEMWPEDVKIRDPSKLTVPCCKKILQLWRGRQQTGGASHTFLFSFFIEDKKLSPALHDLSQQGSTPAPSLRNIGSAAAVATPAPNGCVSSTTRPSSTRPGPTISTADPHMDPIGPTPSGTLIGSPDQPLDPAMVPNAALMTTAMGTPAASTRNMGAVAALATAAANGRASPNASSGAHPAHFTSPMLMDRGLPDDPESDLPVVKKKRKQTARVQSEDYTTDPTTEDETLKRRKGPQKTTRNLALEDAMARNSGEDAVDGAVPILAQKACPKPKRITKQHRRQGPTSAEEQDEAATAILPPKARPKPKRTSKQLQRRGPTSAEEQGNIDGLEDAADPNSRVAAPNLLPKPCPKPKPITKQPPCQDPASVEEQRNIEDALFIRKSTRRRQEKVREAPPAQLRLEKDALKRKGAKRGANDITNAPSRN